MCYELFIPLISFFDSFYVCVYFSPLEPREQEFQYQYQYMYEPQYYVDPVPAYGTGELDCSCKNECAYDEFENGDCAQDQTKCCKFEY